MRYFRQTITGLCLVWTSCFFIAARASVVVPSDVPYYRLRHGNTLYIYDRQNRELIDQLVAYNQAFMDLYDKSYRWRLDEETNLILTSWRQQIPNGYATVFPNLKTVWYPGGGFLIEEMAVSSWMVLLAAHEVAHLYQLNSKEGLNETLKKVVGNPIFIYPLIWPIFIHPNMFTPTFLLEGNATMMESRLNMGGRLHSGEKRALVLAQIKAGDIDPNKLINDDFNFPFGEESYLQGAYFQAHLAAKHGVDKTNQFFRAQGQRYLWPLTLNKTFREHFGASYPQEIREYVRSMQMLAKEQQHTEGEFLLQTLFVSPLNHDQNRIWMLTDEGRQPVRLRVFDKARKSFTSQQIDLIPGKVFFEGATPKTAAFDRNTLYDVTASLYSEGAKMDPRFKGQIVTDQRAGKTVSLDAARSWLDPVVRIDGENYDIAHSSVILDEAGSAYYFRQNGSERVLYKNREPLTKFSGFYAKPTEVTADGSVYFIGATNYGSTLFRARGPEVTRVLRSDRVVDAREIRDGEFLVVEVTAQGHELLIARSEPRTEAPAVYSYGFPSQTLVPPKLVDQQTVAGQEKPYHATHDMRYSAMDVATAYSSTAGFGGSVAGTFVDPLEFQTFQLAYAGTQFRTQAAGAQYTFTKYLPDFYIAYMYEREWWEQRDGVERFAYNQDVTVGMLLPVLRYKRWDAGLGMALTYETENLRNDPSVPLATHTSDREDTYGSLANAFLRYEVPTRIGFLPWRLFEVSFTNKLEALSDTWEKRHNTSMAQLRTTYGLPEEIFATFWGGAAWSESQDIEIVFAQNPLTRDITVPRLVGHDEYGVQSVAFARLEATKVLNTPVYSPRIPLGLNRVAPVVVGQAMFFNDDPLNRYPQNVFEWGYGADIEFLFMHRVPLRMRYLSAFDTRNPDERQDEFRLGFTKSF